VNGQSVYPGRVRFVTIRAPTSGGDNYLHVLELRVLVGGVNVALNKPCSASTTSGSSVCSNAVDGLEGSAFYHSVNVNSDWIRIDLQADYIVDAVTYINRKVFFFVFVDFPI
jgi:hypothetical protein